MQKNIFSVLIIKSLFLVLFGCLEGGQTLSNQNKSIETKSIETINQYKKNWKKAHKEGDKKEMAEIEKKLTEKQISDLKKEVEVIRYGIKINDFMIDTNTIKPGESLEKIFRDYNISPSSWAKAFEVSDSIFNVNNIKIGKKYIVLCDKDSSKTGKCIIYEPTNTEYVVFDFRDSIQVYKGEKEIQIKTRVASGEIETSLWDALIKNNMSPKLVMKLSSDIYAWTIDFFHLPKGDKFIVYFEEKYVEGKFIGIRDVLACSFIHRGKQLNAFRFKENEKYADYFDEDGNNLRKAFLKAPLDFYRISSKYSKNRKHPVTGQWKGHFGTDYAAPSGSPIMSTANGRVIKAEYKRNNGNYVKIKHNNTYSTQYLHMSKYIVKVGDYIEQGDVIGYVGMTGLATGPHVCYRFWKNGKQVDPYKEDLPESIPLKEKNKLAFNKVRDKYISLLNKNSN